ncbi:MAG: hypothetical protein NXI35_25200 [bacterium]|nr:hypothetical protein [bacterium]
MLLAFGIVDRQRPWMPTTELRTNPILKIGGSESALELRERVEELRKVDEVVHVIATHVGDALHHRETLVGRPCHDHLCQALQTLDEQPPADRSSNGPDNDRPCSRRKSRFCVGARVEETRPQFFFLSHRVRDTGDRPIAVDTIGVGVAKALFARIDSWAESVDREPAYEGIVTGETLFQKRSANGPRLMREVETGLKQAAPDPRRVVGERRIIHARDRKQTGLDRAECPVRDSPMNHMLEDVCPDQPKVWS